ncbi:MAG: tetratricopeptide repeat protein [Treponema sp.]|jgi:tetratricopeptide (TPR) repeat protein|nr:tetratricopeptide repeat protein [Treponema sp.]
MNVPDNIVFLSVPKSLSERLEKIFRPSLGGGIASFCHEDDAGAGFFMDPSVPIPVELPPGEKSFDPENLSWEMILSGMIRVVMSNAGYEELSHDDIDYYRRFVLAVKPGILGEFSEAAILKARNGDYNMALEILTALEGLFPEAAEVLLNRAVIFEKKAEALERTGRIEEAETQNALARDVYGKLLAQDPPFPNALFNAGFFYMKRRNFGMAGKCFTAYIPISDEPDKKNKAAFFAGEIEKHDLDDENLLEAYNYIREGDTERGLFRIKSFLERRADVWNGWFVLGWTLRKLGRWEDGTAAFRKAIELGGDNSDTRNELAICLMEQGDYAAARKELEAALIEEPENVKIISNLGVLAMKKGDDNEAAAFFRTVLEIEPEDPIAARGLASCG